MQFEPKLYKHMIAENLTELNANQSICDNEREIWEREEYVNRCGHYGIVGICRNIIKCVGFA